VISKFPKSDYWVQYVCGVFFQVFT
jgi:hypothetical protein